MSEQELKRLREGLLAGTARARPREDCPEPDTLWAAATGELGRGELGPVVDHVASCPACVESWRLAVAAAPEEPWAAGGDGRGRSVARRLSPWLSLAAGLVLALGLLLWPGEVGRGAGQIAERSGQPSHALTLESPHRLPKSDFVLDWTSAVEGTFSLRLRDGAGRLLYQADGLAESQHRVPAEALEGVPAASRLVCTIELRPASGADAERRSFSIELMDGEG